MSEPVSATPLKNLAAALFMGVNVARVTKDRSDKCNVPVIHVKDVINNTLVDVGQLERINLPGTSQNARQRLLATDILVSARGTLMKCALVPDSHVGAVASANFIIVRLGAGDILQPALLWAFLRQPATQARILSRVTSTAQPALNIRDLEELQVPLPPHHLQPDLVRLLVVAERQYKCAIESAQFRKDESMEIVARYMDTAHAS